ncbi:hypothetical protein Vau01_050480 [Virgisporangium aurantiacum]|uniref:Uncharacterized protein n=1 Tax=Virgisporangium aurantiacum TaxID=175570 RepID=A0A8J3Z6Y5_9ACTN|nr:hypothetical protein Vau01_050480 [Virgisporangium aurantiacum]
MLAGALAVFVGYMTLVLPAYRCWRWPRLSEPELDRLERVSRWRYAGHLALGGVLLLAPGVTARNLGLALPTGRGWVAATGITMGAIAVAVLLALKHSVAHSEHGCHDGRDAAARRRAVRDTVVGCLGDTVVFIVLPPAVGYGALGLPLAHVSAFTVLGYGFVHLSHRLWSMLGWTAVTAVAVAAYLMTASALLPAILLTAVAVSRIYAVPMLPDDPPVRPPPRPPLVLVDPPGPTSAS